MRLPGSTCPFSILGSPACVAALGVVCLLAATGLTPLLGAQDTNTMMTSARERAHESEQWRDIQAHLPDPATATAQVLEMQADILRARRFPDDALEFYRYALQRGGNPAILMNKLGLTELEMRNVELARAYFQRTVKLNRKYADAWNNLGAVEYLDRGAVAAVGDYKHAIKLDKHQAVFHANLATADFETRDYKGARREMGEALELDPTIFDKEQSTGGVEAHVLTAEDRARFSLEMAKIYAHSNQQEQMLHSLAQAAEAGMDIQREMAKDAALAKFEQDPRVVLLVHNARILRTGHDDTVSASSQVPVPVKPVIE